MRADESAALRHLGQASDAFAVDAATAPWALFFDANDLSAMTGTVWVELARTVNPRHAVRAIPFLRDAVAAYGPEMGRSRSLTRIMLALGHAIRRDTRGSRAGGGRGHQRGAGDPVGACQGPPAAAGGCGPERSTKR